MYMDFRDQSKIINIRVEAILDASATPATRAVHLLDRDLAQEVVNGLARYEFVQHIAIYDDRQDVMAIFDTPMLSSETAWLTINF